MFFTQIQDIFFSQTRIAIPNKKNNLFETNSLTDKNNENSIWMFVCTEIISDMFT